jgi:hypothetical protein
MSSASEYFYDVGNSGASVTSLVAPVVDKSYLKDIFGKEPDTQILKLPNGKSVTVAKIQKDLQRIGDRQEIIINGRLQQKITEDADYLSFISNLLDLVGNERILEVTEILGQRSTIALIDKITEEFITQFSDIVGKPMFETESIKDQSVTLSVEKDKCQIIRKIWGSIKKYCPPPTEEDGLPAPKALGYQISYSGEAIFNLENKTKEYLISLYK